MVLKITLFQERTKTYRDDIKQFTEQINGATNDIVKARNLMLKDEIEPADFREIKSESEKRISLLEIKLMGISKNNPDVEPFLEKAISVLSHLEVLYKDGDVKKKRSIIG